jgi:hypothetical protein
MSLSEITLKLSCPNGAARLFVVDGEFCERASGVSPWETKLEPGIYLLKATVGGASSQRVEVLREAGQEYAFTLSAPTFDSPLPIEGTGNHHEYQESSPEQFTRNNAPQVAMLGQEAAVVLYVRDTTRRNFQASSNPAYAKNFSGFHLLSSDGSELVDFDRPDIHKNVSDGYFGARVGLKGDVYALAWEHDRDLFCLPINAVAGFTVQIYLLLQPVAADSVEMRPDFRSLSCVYDPMTVSYAKNRPDLSMLESVRLALEKGSNVADTPLMRAVLESKLENPMLGLYVAHLLLLDPKSDQAFLEQTITKTAAMLGSNFPDIVAIAWKYEKIAMKRPAGFSDRPWPELLKAIAGPPLLMRSWDLLVACNEQVAAGQSASFPAFKVAPDLVSAGSYLVWRMRPKAGHTEMVRESGGPSHRGSVSSSVLIGLPSLGGLADSLKTVIDFPSRTLRLELPDALKQLGSILPTRFSRKRLDASEILTPADAAMALQNLARKYKWRGLARELEQPARRPTRLSGLQRDLIGVLAQAAIDRATRQAMDASYVTTLLESKRVPLSTMADALAGLDEIAQSINRS